MILCLSIPALCLNLLFLLFVFFFLFIVLGASYISLLLLKLLGRWPILLLLLLTGVVASATDLVPDGSLKRDASNARGLDGS